MLFPQQTKPANKLLASATENHLTNNIYPAPVPLQYALNNYSAAPRNAAERRKYSGGYIFGTFHTTRQGRQLETGARDEPRVGAGQEKGCLSTARRPWPLRLLAAAPPVSLSANIARTSTLAHPYCRFRAPAYLILWEIHTGPYLAGNMRGVSHPSLKLVPSPFHSAGRPCDEDAARHPLQPWRTCCDEGNRAMGTRKMRGNILRMTTSFVVIGLEDRGWDWFVNTC